MARQVLIIHGWSDHSASFRPLADFLSKNGYAPKLLWLGDYISQDDDVRVEDVGRRMGEVIDEMIAAKQLDKSFDAIVHSTGGLVARAWLTTRYRGEAPRCPMKRLVMLAPANYGSKLAATGKSFLGRVVKGYDNWFETGKSMLDNLELASPFQWQLAQRDTLIAPGGDATRYYSADGVWPFVIVGTHPYTSALRRIVNENGSDGTVRVCAANLNARGLTLDFRESDPDKVAREWTSRLQCAAPLAVLPTRTHGSIIDPERAGKADKEDIPETAAERVQLGQLILQALACRHYEGYAKIQQEWEKISEATAARHSNPPAGEDAEYFHQYLQLNTRVIDDHGRAVTDYFLEFYSDTGKRYEDANTYLHGKVIEDVKKNSIDESLRNLYFDRTDLVEGYYALLPKGTEPVMYMSISAASPGKNIHYFERQKEGAKQQVRVHLEADPTKRRFRRNTTHFLEIVIPRMPNVDVFKLTNLTKL